MGGAMSELKVSQADPAWPLLHEHLARWRDETEALPLKHLLPSIWDWLSSLGSEFWSAIAGAIVGGVIAYILHRSALMEARRERGANQIEARAALAHALLFKVLKIFEGLRGLEQHVDDAVAKVDTTASLAATMYQIANLPDPTSFSSDEMGMLLSLGNDDVFNDVMQLDTIHNSILPVWERYGFLREKVQQLHEAETFDGATGASTILVKKGSRLDIALFEANQLASELASRAKRDAADAKKTAIALQALLAEKLGITVGFSFVD